MLESHSTYVRNEVAQTAPHHTNSYLYAQSRTRNVDEAGAGGELACFWVLPAHHGHITGTRTKYLNNYTYASWPAQFKERVALLNSFFWEKLR